VVDGKEGGNMKAGEFLEDNEIDFVGTMVEFNYWWSGR
jgi:hypothetical protein